jgi:hypothetical protein
VARGPTRFLTSSITVSREKEAVDKTIFSCPTPSREKSMRSFAILTRVTAAVYRTLIW